jgi:hypothetical protein
LGYQHERELRKMTVKMFIAQKYNGTKYIPTTHKKFVEERIGVEAVACYFKKDFKKYADVNTGYIKFWNKDKSVMVKLDGKLVTFKSEKEAFYNHIYRCWLRAGERHCLAGV